MDRATAGLELTVFNELVTLILNTEQQTAGAALIVCSRQIKLGLKMGKATVGLELTVFYELVRSRPGARVV